MQVYLDTFVAPWVFYNLNKNGETNQTKQSWKTVCKRIIYMSAECPTIDQYLNCTLWDCLSILLIFYHVGKQVYIGTSLRHGGNTAFDLKGKVRHRVVTDNAWYSNSSGVIFKNTPSHFAVTKCFLCFLNPNTHRSLVRSHPGSVCQYVLKIALKAPSCFLKISKEIDILMTVFESKTMYFCYYYVSRFEKWDRIGYRCCQLARHRVSPNDSNDILAGEKSLSALDKYKSDLAVTAKSDLFLSNVNKFLSDL